MVRNGRATAAIALGITVACVGLVGCGQTSDADPFEGLNSLDSLMGEDNADGADDKDAFTGTKKITVDGKKVNVSCSGRPVDGRPVVVLLAGGGDGLDKLAGIQQTLSAKGRACSYDRLGAGASDKPDGPQTFKSTGKVLTAVIDRVAGGGPVVLAGHSLGGLISARYAPDHRDSVAGLVLMDATSPTQSADLTRDVPDSATGTAAELRDQTLAVLKGESPEKLAVPDGRVRSAGDIPTEVIRHGKRYLAAVPEYGPAMERSWTEGQHAWLKVSGRSRLSTAEKSEHYIYVDQPGVAVRAIERVVAQATDRG